MALVVSNTGEVEILKRVLNYSATGDVKLHLFKTNVTPGETDTVDTYTESTATGYSATALTGASWVISTVGGTTTASYPEVTFTYTAAENLYGYYITNSASTTLIWAEAFPTVFSIPSGGGAIKVAPKITCD